VTTFSITNPPTRARISSSTNTKNQSSLAAITTNGLPVFTRSFWAGRIENDQRFPIAMLHSPSFGETLKSIHQARSWTHSKRIST